MAPIARTRKNRCVPYVILVFLSLAKPPETHALTPDEQQYLPQFWPRDTTQAHGGATLRLGAPAWWRNVGALETLRVGGTSEELGREGDGKSRETEKVVDVNREV